MGLLIEVEVQPEKVLSRVGSMVRVEALSIFSAVRLGQGQPAQKASLEIKTLLNTVTAVIWAPVRTGLQISEHNRYALVNPSVDMVIAS